MSIVRVALVTAASACVLAASQAPPPPPFAPAVERGGLVFVSGILPSPPSGDITAQTAQVLDELKARLERAGTSLDRVVSTSAYLAGADDFAAMNAVWKKYWPSSPPARTTVVARLPVPGARIQVSAIAAGRATERAVVIPPGWPVSASPLSPAVRAGDVMFLSGQVPRRGSDNALVTGGIEAQTDAVFSNAEAILKADGWRLADVISARVFLTDGGTFQAMNASYRPHFGDFPPTRATVITPLVSPDFQIEIAMVAAKGGWRDVVPVPNTGGQAPATNPNFSAALRHGPRLFLSGMLGVVPGKAPDTTSQTAETLDRLERAMTTNGYRWTDVAESLVFVTDMAATPDILRVFAERCGGRLPVGTVVGTGLVSPDARVEIMMTASK